MSESTASRERTTLPGRDYHAVEVFDLERERIFARNWFYAGRAEGLDEPGDFVAVDVAGESVIVVRTKDGDLRGFYNVCRHRGSRLCDDHAGRMKGAIKCPYHAWAYSFEGKLIGTPNVAKDEIDRDSLSLWPISVDTWQGFLFVYLDPDPVPLEESLRNHPDSPLSFARFNLDGLADRAQDGERGEGQLENPDRQLQRVSALPDRASRARPGHPRVSRRRGI